MAHLRTVFAALITAAGVAGASAAHAQADRYAVGPSTPNSDGSRGYGSYVAMAGSSFVDGRQYGNREDDRIYPLDTAARPASWESYAAAPSSGPALAYAEPSPRSRVEPASDRR